MVSLLVIVLKIKEILPKCMAPHAQNIVGQLKPSEQEN
jgi:hypothetical protein